MTAEQLEASRAERMRLNGNGALTLEDARTWIEETGLCLFLPKRQFSTSIAPSFVEAVAGQRNATPEPKQIALAEELLVRLETDGVAVRLNLLGLPGEQPDFVVAAWVLPYVYALRGDRDWRRSPQLTGSRQVSQLAVQAYKQLELGDTTIAKLTHALGREVTEGAVLRAITELWQQLRIIPVVSAPGQAAQWQLLRTRFQKAIAEGASTGRCIRFHWAMRRTFTLPALCRSLRWLPHFIPVRRCRPQPTFFTPANMSWICRSLLRSCLRRQPPLRLPLWLRARQWNPIRRA